MKIYYGLSFEETKLDKLSYSSSEYQYKGVNTSLEGLKKFVKDYHLDHIKYYTVVDISCFKVADEVLYDEQYDMLAVLIPFEFQIDNVYDLGGPYE